MSDKKEIKYFAVFAPSGASSIGRNCVLGAGTSEKEALEAAFGPGASKKSLGASRWVAECSEDEYERGAM